MAKFGFKAAPTAQVHTPAENNNVEISREGDIAIELDLSLIDFDPLQHRQEIDDAALDELAKSIETHNVIHSILVRPATPAGRYPLVVGERRCKASLRAGKKTIPAIVRQLTDLQADAIQLIENAQREGVNPLHTAQKLGRMLKDHNIKHIELAELIGKSETYITQHLRLLELPPEVARSQKVAQFGTWTL
jgi:ParB family chromosome partitioning protein